MVRLFHVYFPTRTLLLAASETILVGVGFLAAMSVTLGRDTLLALTYEMGAARICVAAGVCMLCMYYYDLYDSLILRSPREQMIRLIEVLGTLSVILSALYYVFPSTRLGWTTFLYGNLLISVLVLAERKLYSVVNRAPLFVERVLLLGEGLLGDSLTMEMQARPELGMRLLGYVGNSNNSDPGPSTLRRLGGTQELADIVERERVRRIIVIQGERRGSLPVDALLRLKLQGVMIQDGADFYELIAGKTPLDTLRPSWLLFSPGFGVSKATLLYKRSASILLSLVCLLLSLPVMVLIAMAIRLDSPGPVIFRQPRIGKDGRTFTLFKFRSMRNGADGNGKPRPAQMNDERCTRVGRWIRRFRLDELPQLYNILLGDMYFVGPRPFVPNEEMDLSEKIPYYTQRWAVKPGATGWAQIQRGYCSTVQDNMEKLSYDLFYIRNMSIGFDLLIIFHTAKILLLGRGAR